MAPDTLILPRHRVRITTQGLNRSTLGQHLLERESLGVADTASAERKVSQ